MRTRLSTFVALALLAGLLPFAVLPAANAQPTEPAGPLPDPVVVPYHVTGPASERMNLVILGDGYQADQQSIFHEDLDRNVAVLLTTEPYKSYRDYLNIYAVELASIDYGVRCDPDGRVRHPDGTIRDTGEREGPIEAKNTALRMVYSHSSGSGCTDPLARGVVYGGAPVGCEAHADRYPPGVNPCETGAQARTRIMNDHVAPVLGISASAQNVQTLAVFNSFTYGGIGGTHATTSGGSPQGPWISLHELGHSHGTLADEYAYFERGVERDCRVGSEPSGNSGFHHTNYTSTEQMIADQFKWWRWIGEESLSGGEIGLWEGGMYFPCGVRRPSDHSMMRHLGFYFDQIGLEHMVARITGLRNTGQMPLPSRPSGTAGADEVLWVKPLQPRGHALQVTWRLGGANGEVLATNNQQFLDLGALDVAPGTVVHVEVRDPVGPDGIDWVRNPSTANAANNSGYNGPRFVQTRQWTVGEDPVTPSPVGAEITNSTPTSTPVGGSDWVFVETNHPTDRVLDVTWRVNGAVVPNPANARNIDIGALGLAAGTYTLTATVTDPADPEASDSREWVVDNVDPSAPRTLSASLTTLAGDLEHPVYFGGWDMWLHPEDDSAGYDEDRYVAGELQLNRDGWYGYFGFPEEPEGSPFKFRHSGTDVKALTYGNLGSGGLSKAPFEQYFDGHPSGTFEPGYGTHLVEHRAIDAAGNISEPEAYRATVLPGESPECTTTITGTRGGRLLITDGVTCLAPGASVGGNVLVRNGASLVVSDGATIGGDLIATDAAVVQLFGATVNGDAHISGTTDDVIVAGSHIGGELLLFANTGRVTPILSGATREYGVLLIGNTITGRLLCEGNTPSVNDFDVPNTIGGAEQTDLCASGFAPAHAELDALAAAGGITAGLEDKVRHALDMAQAWLANPNQRGPAVAHLDRAVRLLEWQADVVERTGLPQGDPAGLRALAATIRALHDTYRV